MKGSSQAVVLLLALSLLATACTRTTTELGTPSIAEAPAESQSPVAPTPVEPAVTAVPSPVPIEVPTPEPTPTPVAPATLAMPDEPILNEIPLTAAMATADQAVLNDVMGRTDEFPALAVGQIRSTFRDSSLPAYWRIDTATTTATAAQELPLLRGSQSGFASGVVVFGSRQIVTGAAVRNERLRPIVWERSSPTAPWRRESVGGRPTDAWFEEPQAGTDTLGVVAKSLSPNRVDAAGQAAIEEALWIRKLDGDWIEADLPTFDSEIHTIDAFGLHEQEVAVAFGTDTGDAVVVVHSSDGGDSFEVVDADLRSADSGVHVHSLIWFQDQWLLGGATGSDESAFAPVLFSSADGQVWEQRTVDVQLEVPAPAPGGFGHLTATGDLVVASIGGVDQRIVVASNDGVTWRTYSADLQGPLNPEGSAQRVVGLTFDSSDLLVQLDERLARWGAGSLQELLFEPSLAVRERVLRNVIYDSGSFRVLSALDSELSFQLFALVEDDAWSPEPVVAQFGVNAMMQTDNGPFFSGVEPNTIDGQVGLVGQFRVRQTTDRLFDGTEFDKRGVLKAASATGVGDRWFVVATNQVDGINDHYVATIGPEGDLDYWSADLARQDLNPIGLCPANDDGVVPVLLGIGRDVEGQLPAESVIELWADGVGFQGFATLDDGDWDNVRLTGCYRSNAGHYSLVGTECGFDPVIGAGIESDLADDDCRAVVFGSQDGTSWLPHLFNDVFEIAPTTGLTGGVALDDAVLLLGTPHRNKGQITMWLATEDRIRQVPLGALANEVIFLRDAAAGDGRVVFVSQDQRVLTVDVAKILEAVGG